ncbi:Retrovirus-related Pol polyprotein from transposon 412 [Labeo rohita]|uniref:Gypsy retrotransposon integrase-like protein 1 n=1 Tax=Labeo rohita TaxID=84645 RepID=A0A498NJR8_LABRO|nr:Retrovirus-related Pol polyprotein from transposon 412 [Labeo rohita]
MKISDDYWRILSDGVSEPSSSCEQFLDVMANTCRWRGGDLPDKVGTVKLQQSITLMAKQEHLVWGRLPSDTAMSPGSTVIVEATSSRTMPRDILIGRVVTPLWGDRWVPFKVTNLSDKPVTLKRNCKLADVFPCLAVEDFELLQGFSHAQAPTSEEIARSGGTGDFKQRLKAVSLNDIDIDSCSASDTAKEKLVQLLESYNDVFSKHALDCGEVRGFVHRIRLTDNRPFRLPYRRVPPAHYQKLRQVLSEMEEQGIIRKSVSEYASPLVLVWKKDGSLRICTDFRWLNARTIKDAHPLPHQSDCLVALGGNSLFSTMDLTSGFYNIPMAEEDKKYTAFATPVGLHEYNRMPQGLCNSPASFMRMMLSIFGDLNFSSLLCYLDDLLVFAPDETTALERLETVFQRLRSHNLKLSPKKCHLMQASVKFLGHIINGNGVSVDPSKVEVIAKLSKADLMEEDGCTPSVRRIKSVLGMILYYQHFIPNCSSVAKPLFSLTSGQKRRTKVKSEAKAGTYRKLKPTDWTPECDDALTKLKMNLLHSVVLAHPDFSLPLILSIDASLEGLGAVLSQIPAGEEKARPIAFASKSLSNSQKRYPAHKLEFLALKWSVCEKFSHWLKGHIFTVWTDNNPLTYILTKAKLDACEQRWVSKLAAYSFDLKHIAGSKNTVADALSRDPFTKKVSHRLITERYDSLLTEAESIDKDGVQDTFRLQVNSLHLSSQSSPVSCDHTTVRTLLNLHNQWETVTELRAMQTVQSIQNIATTGPDTISAIPFEDIRQDQESDPAISKLIPYLSQRKRPSRREMTGMDAGALVLLKQWDRLKVQDGVIYRVSKDPLSNHKRFQLVLPSSLRARALAGVHDLAGHQGQSRTLQLTRQRFFWPRTERDIREYVKCCQRCILAKTPEPSARAPLENIRTSAPMELVCLDFWSAEDSKQHSVDVLVVTDHFTKLAHAFPYGIYGFPTRIHTDQGTNFESTLIAELLKLAGIEKSHTTAYHPMGNGGTERFNWTLGSMLRSLPLKEKHKWPEQIQTLTFAYNATVHETTGYAPFQLMFGRIPKLPVDVIFGQVLHDPVIVDHGSYAKTLMSYLHEAARIAQKHTEKEQKKQAKSYNRKVKGTCLNIGDRVLLANKSERGKKKLADKWDPTIYTVKDRNLQTNIYKLTDEDGKSKVVHRNLILDISFLPIEPPPDDKDIQFNAENMETESCRSELSGSSEEGSSEDGTRAWVLDGQDEFESQGPVDDDDDLESDHSIQSRRSVCEQDLSENEAAGGYSNEVSGIETESPVDDPNSQTQTVNDPHANSIPDTQVQIPTDTQGVRTRAGRVVKKPALRPQNALSTLRRGKRLAVLLQYEL